MPRTGSIAEATAAEDPVTTTEYAAATEDTAAASRSSHRTSLPPGFITVRIMQLVLAVALVGLFGFTIAVDDDDESWVAAIGLGTSVYAVVILIWIILASYGPPKLYNYWAVLAFEILSLLAWIDCMIWSMLLAFGVDDDYDDYSDCGDTYDPTTDSYYDVPCLAEPSSDQALDITGPIIAAFTAVQIILWFVSLVVISVFISRHRLAGGHNKPGSPAPVYLDPSVIQRQYIDLEKANLEIRAKCLALERQNLNLQRQKGFADASQPDADEERYTDEPAPGRSAVV